jgi:hypothetical protein
MKHHLNTNAGNNSRYSFWLFFPPKNLPAWPVDDYFVGPRLLNLEEVKGNIILAYPK